MAIFTCRSIPDRGLLLVPHGDAAFDALFEDIRRRLETLNPARPPSRTPISEIELDYAAILINRAEQAIAGLALEWQFEETSGRKYSHSTASAFGRSLLLPFGLPQDILPVNRYWNTILPGSKRLLADMQIIGDNTDVRPPRPDEIWRGGGIGSTVGSRSRPLPEMHSVVLVIDGLFFADGEFIGPDHCLLWEDVFYEAEAKLETARRARTLHDRGLGAADILAELEKFLGPDTSPPPMRPKTAEDFRAQHRHGVAGWLRFIRPQRSDESIVYNLLSWLDTERPQLRKS